MKEKNELNHTGWLAAFVLLALLLLHALPAVQWRGRALRRVDLLADVRLPREAPPVAVDDTLLSPPPRVKPAFVDTCPAGMTCIDDYSDSLLRGMTPFYRALDGLAASPQRPVRIAYLGDSFIEADILTADLRAMLQQHYGGCGVGFVPITSATNEFRPTVRHAFKGWESHLATDSTGFDRSLQGLAGQYFLPSAGAYVELRGQRDYASRLDTCHRATIYFRVRDGGRLTLSAQVNHGQAVSRTFRPSDSLQQMVVEGAIGSVRWTVLEADSTLFYGAAMDGDGGIVLDNFSLRGTTGLSLRRIPMEALRQFNALRPYDLIVLQYGLNVAHEEVSNYAYYATGMRPVLDSLKLAFPQAGILVVGVGDRDDKDEDGRLRTMPCIRQLVRYQQRMAADNGVAFWNLYEAMGGEASMAKLMEANPPMANLDYTHINFRGGEHLAGLLYDVLVYGKQQYDRRRAYERGL